jgi:DNA-binding NarL/FixJ family response regulator
MHKPIKIVIIDDHPMVIAGISMFLSKSDNFQVIASFTNALDVLEYAKTNQIDLILLDVFMPEINGIHLCKKIKQNYPKIAILGMSSQSERSLVMQFIQNGANGYLLKNATLEEFYDCIEKAIIGEIVFSNEVKILISKPEISDFKKTPTLTRREKEILVLISKGKNTQEIADTLFLSFLTVQTHRRNILSKLEVKNVAELINLATKNRLI